MIEINTYIEEIGWEETEECSVQPVYPYGYVDSKKWKKSSKEKYDRYQAYLKEQEERLAQQNEDFQL